MSISLKNSRMKAGSKKLLFPDQSSCSRVILGVNVMFINNSTDELNTMGSLITSLSPSIHPLLFSDLGKALAVLKAKRKMPDLIVIAMNIGALKCRAFNSLLKEHMRMRLVPVIGIGEYYHSEEMLKSGFEDFYTLPENIFELEQVLDEVKKKWIDHSF